MKPSTLVLAGLMVAFRGGVASAQGIVGGAFIVSRLPPGDGYIPGSIAVPPNGLTQGGVVFAGIAVNPRVAFQGEVSIPTSLENVWRASHPSITIEDTTTHRDSMASLLVRVRAASWCDLFAGGGADFERTRVVSVTRAWAPPLGIGTRGAIERTRTYSSDATRFVFTTCLDLPIRLSRSFALLPTGRVHIVRRDTPPEPSTIDEPRPFSPTSRYVFRFGIGGRVEF